MIKLSMDVNVLLIEMHNETEQMGKNQIVITSLAKEVMFLVALVS